MRTTVIALLALVASASVSFAQSDEEVKKFYEDNVAKFTVAIGQFGLEAEQNCTVKVQGRKADAEGCAAAYAVIISRLKVEIDANKARIAALEQTADMKKFVFFEIFSTEFLDKWNADTQTFAKKVKEKYLRATAKK